MAVNNELIFTTELMIPGSVSGRRTKEGGRENPGLKGIWQ